MSCLRLSLAVYLFLTHSGFAADKAPSKDSQPLLTFNGWGTYEDPTAATKLSFAGDVLTLRAFDGYVDNFPQGKVNSPRIVRPVTGNFDAQVKVIELDPAEPGTVHANLGNFPTAYHAGTLLLRADDKNMVRVERISMARRGRQSHLAAVQVIQGGQTLAYHPQEVEEKPVILRMQRESNRLLASFSQDDGRNWTEFPSVDVEFLPEKIKVGVSMTSNTQIGSLVRFRDYRLSSELQR